MGEPHILIADDEDDVLLLCRVNLEFEGFRVTEAGNGQEAVERARDERPDLVLLDVMMPVKDGWQTLSELKSDPDLHDVPVVMLTARVQNEHQLHGLRAGAADYVTKPFHPTALVRTIRAVLDADVVDREERRREALRKLELFSQL